MRDVRRVGLHPSTDAGVKIVEVLADQRAARVFTGRADAIEGDDHRVAEVRHMLAQPQRGLQRHVRAVQ
jgi:hypothetical protein